MRRTSWWTLVTRGQTASTTIAPRPWASRMTAGAEPWAESIRGAPDGTGIEASTKTTPAASKTATTAALCTIW